MFGVKVGLLCFWSAWFCVAFATNLCGGLKALGKLPAGWRFASDNFAAVAEAAKIHRAPKRLAAFLFSGAVLWQLAAAALFGRAAMSSLARASLDRSALDAAFAAGAGLWAAFMVADEIFLRYENEGSHAILFTAGLASWMAIYVLP